MLKQDRYTVDTIERIWFRPFNVTCIQMFIFVSEIWIAYNNKK